MVRRVLVLWSLATACTFDPRPPPARVGPDAGDAATDEAGLADAGGEARDAAPTDAAARDTGTSAPDAGFTDAGFADAAGLDAGPADTGLGDGGAPDAAPADAGAPAAVALAVLDDPSPVPAGVCSSPIRVERRDAAGQPAADPGPLLVQLDRVGVELLLYLPGCSGPPVSSVQIPAGAASTAFALRGVQPGAATVRVRAAGFTTQNLAVEIRPGPPVDLVFLSASSPVPWATCSPAVTLRRRDAFGNAASGPATDVDLRALPAGTLTFFADPACGTATDTATFGAADSDAAFHFLPEAFGAARIEASHASLGTVVQSQTVADCPVPCGAACAECCREACAAPPSSCSLRCNETCPCELDCAANPDCDPACGGGRTCGIDCRSISGCNPSCGGQSICVIDCRGPSGCGDVSCSGGSSCLLYCGTSGTCAISGCSTPVVTCAPNILACNRECP